MAVEIATLGLGVQNVTAIANANAAALESMGVKGEAAQRKIAGSSSPVEAAIKRQALTVEQSRRAWAAAGGDMDRLKQQLSGVSGGMTQAAAATEQTARATTRLTDVTTSGRLSLGRLGNQFTSLTSQIAGVHPVVGNVVSVLGNFAVGSLLMTGILGGTAILAALYATITNGARKARQEQEALTKALADQFRPETGRGSAIVEKYTAALNQQADAMKRLRLLQGAGNDFEVSAAFRSAGLAAPTRSRQVEIDRETERLRLANVALNRARASGAGVLEDVSVTSDIGQQRAAAERERAARDRERSERFLADAEAAKRRVEDFTKARQLSPVADSVIKPLTGLLTPALIRAAEAAKRLSDSFESAKDRLQLGLDGWKRGNIGSGIKAGVQGSVGDALAQFSPANIAGGLVTSGINYLVSGLTEMGLELLNGGAAAEAYAREQRRLNLEYRAGVAAFKGDDLGAELAKIALEADRLSESLSVMNLTITNLVQNPGIIKQTIEEQARIDAQERRNVEAAERRAWYAEQYGLEDLEVRNLRATGFGDQADRQAFVNRQERESTEAYEKAMADGFLSVAEELYLNTLKTTQNSELIAYNNGLLSTALRNAPTGFYGVERYLGQYATPSGPAGYPTDSGVNPPGPRTGPGNLTPPGGQRPITIVLRVDGKVLTSVVVDNLDQTASATGGAGTSRAEALELYQT